MGSFDNAKVFFYDIFTNCEEEQEREKYQAAVEKLENCYERMKSNYPQALMDQLSSVKKILSIEYDLKGDGYDLFKSRLEDWVRSYETIANEYEGAMKQVEESLNLAKENYTKWKGLEDIAEGRVES